MPRHSRHSRLFGKQDPPAILPADEPPAAADAGPAGGKKAGNPGRAMCNAAKFGVEKWVRQMLDKGAHPDAQADTEWGWAPALQIAIFYRHSAIVRVLLDAGASPNIVDCTGQTALHMVAAGGRYFHRPNEVHTDVPGSEWTATVELLAMAGANLGATCRLDKATPKLYTPRGVASLTVRPISALAPTNFCTRDITAEFDAAIAAAFRPWSRGLHRRLPRPSREVVLTVMLCAHRLAAIAEDNDQRRQAASAPPPPGEAAAGVTLRAKPVLPLEMWMMVLGLLRTVDLLPRRL